MTASIEDIARTAVTLAATVCRSVARDFGELGPLTKADLSPVTIADLASQAIIAVTLKERLPHAFATLPLIAEEDAGFLLEPAHQNHRKATLKAVRSVRPDLKLADLLRLLAPPKSPDLSLFWTLDPVDGTKGFLRKQQYAIALALVESGRPTLGILGCPNLSVNEADGVGTVSHEGSLYLARRGQGVEEWTCSAEATAPLRHLLRRNKSHEPVIACASVEKAHTQLTEVARILSQVAPGATLLHLDSSAKYAVVARGQADAYLRLPTRQNYVERIWDHAAGVVVAEEAGCVVTDLRGKELEFGLGRGLEANHGVLVATPDLHARLLAALAP